jgi:hypothetical protein
MKTRFMALALLLAACGGSSPKAEDMAHSPDLSAPADFSMAADMSQLTCKQMIACVMACSSSGLNACVEGCIENGSTAALQSFTPLEDCAKPACYDADAGSDACAMTGSGACKTCFMTNCGAQLAACEAS